MITQLLLVFISLLVFGSVSTRTTGKRPDGQFDVEVPKSLLWKADRSVSKKRDVDEDVKNQMSAYMGWERLLSPAPVTIGLLGDLMIMSSLTRDFAIDGQLPSYGAIQYVKYPKSFRATLVQIGNEGQRAFMVAHNNMDTMQLLTADVPGYMKQATEILVTGDEELVADYLPAPMWRIREAAQLSVSLSKAVVWQFERVMNLTSEVLEMCTSEKSLQEANIERAIREQSTVNLTLTSFQQLVDQLNSSIARDAAVMSRAEEDMRKALKDMPSGWEMIGMDFVQNTADMLTTTMRIGTAPFFSINRLTATSVDSIEHRIGTADGSPAASDSANQPTRAEPQSAIEPNPCIVECRNPIMKMEGLANQLYYSYRELTSIDSAKGRYNPASDAINLKKIAMKVDMCPPVAEIVEHGLLFVNELARLASLSKADNVTEEEFKRNRQAEFDDVSQNVGFQFRTMAYKMKKFVTQNQQAIPNNTPLLSEAREKINTKGSASQQALAMCKYRADMAQATLLSTRQAMEKTTIMMIENNKEVIRLLTEQQSLKLDEIRYDEIIKALEKGLQKLAILKEHWTQLVMFFQKIANTVENVAAKSIEDFANHIDTTSLNLRNIHKKFVIDQLYAMALKATQATSSVNQMAETYVNVSEKYIMPRVSSLSKFIVIDPKMAEAERGKLLSDCSKDSDAIVDMIVTEKQKDIRRIKQRAADIKREYAFLDQVKERQIKELRQTTELEIDERKAGKQLSIEELQIRVDVIVNMKIKNDEFLGGNNILEDDGNKDEEEY